MKLLRSLVALTAQTDIQISNLECEDASVTDFLVARGGNAGWVVDDPDRMYVLKSISGTGTVTFPGGQESYQFAQTHGNKTGKTTTIDCEADYLFDGDGATDEGHMEWNLVQIW